MRGVILLLGIILMSALVVATLGRSRCDRSVVNIDQRSELAVVTFLNDCGGNSVATEVGFAQVGADADTADTVLVLPGKDYEHVAIEELETKIAIVFPRGSKLVGKLTDWRGRPIEYVPTEPAEQIQ